MQDIDISVIIPIYNHSIYIHSCLKSIINQDLDIEVILVNNANNHIKELTEFYVNKFKNFKIIHDEFKTNSIDLNLAIQESKGKYV
ncbi:MAG: glycosyltransferase, partial [Methanobrevibacter sp.]|nr:glycosyltransferase [Methanobrevibacter sp.]